MNGYLLDTNIISDVIRHPDGAVAARLQQLAPKQVCTSIVVAAKLRYGCAKKGSPRLTARVEALLTVVPALALDAPADLEYGRLRADLEAQGLPIGMNDLLIAAHARALGLTLVTDNAREFGRVRGLVVENWLER